MANKVLIIYNPNAGKGKAEKVAEKLKTALNNAVLFNSHSLDAMREFHKQNANNKDEYTVAVIIGGDGTIGPNVDAMIKNNIDIPIYAMGRGTANDFARFFKTNKSIKKTAQILYDPQIIEIDTINANDTYAISNAAGGAFTNGVTKYSKGAKKIFGRFAYLFKAFWKGLFLKSQKVHFVVENEVFDQQAFVFYILNTKNVGSMKNAAPLANPSDGLLDLVIIKRCGLWGRICLVTSLFFKRLHKSKRVIYRQARNFKVEIVGENIIHNFTKTDIDGNAGGDYPLNVTVGPKIRVIVPKKFDI